MPASQPARLPVIVAVKGRPGHHMKNTPMRDTNWGIPRTIEQTEGEEKRGGGTGPSPPRPPPEGSPFAPPRHPSAHAPSPVLVVGGLWVVLGWVGGGVFWLGRGVGG